MVFIRSPQRREVMLWILCWSVSGALLGNLRAKDLGYRQFQAPGGTVIDYRLAVPEESRQQYPFLLALPPGSQDREAVDWGWQQLYLEQAERRGWVVVSPVAPSDRRLFRDGFKYLPELLRTISKEYPPGGGRFHLAGVSNGGLMAFMLAVRYPELVHSMAVLPGWPHPEDLGKLDPISALPVRMWVGENDNPAWIDLMRRAEQELKALGAPVELLILPGEGHTIRSLMGGVELFDFLDSHR